MGEGINLLLSLDFNGLLSLFWFYFIFELPRYTFSTLAVGWRAVFEPRLPDPDPELPVSVLLVGHNEGSVLARSVRALAEQTQKNLQIVVVDDGSTDNTAEVGTDLRRAGEIDTFVSTGLRGGKAAALNLGLQYCRHEILIVVDIDTSIDRDAVSRIIAPLLAEPDCGGVAGNLAVRNPDRTILTKMQAIEYVTSISLGRQFTAMIGILVIISGAFGAFRASAIRAVGGWDVGPGDDSNLTTKLRRSGWSIRFAEDAWAFTDVPEAHGAFVRQRLRWSRSVIRNRLRKFFVVFDPRQSNFAARDVLATLNVLWFNVGLSIAFVVYLVRLFMEYGSLAFPVIVAVYILGMMGDLLEFFLAIILVRRLRVTRFFPYLFGFTFFVSYYQRVIRLVAYASEIGLRRSYDDPFYPTKVRQAQDQF